MGGTRTRCTFGGELDFGLHAKIAPAFLNIHDQKADVPDNCRDDDGVAVDSEPLLERSDRAESFASA